MSRALAALASQYVGRRVRLTSGQTGTITRVTPQGLIVAISGLRADDIGEWLD